MELTKDKRTMNRQINYVDFHDECLSYRNTFSFLLFFYCSQGVFFLAFGVSRRNKSHWFWSLGECNYDGWWTSSCNTTTVLSSFAKNYLGPSEYHTQHNIYIYRERERESQRERDRERQRQRQTQTERDRDRETGPGNVFSTLYSQANPQLLHRVLKPPYLHINPKVERIEP